LTDLVGHFPRRSGGCHRHESCAFRDVELAKDVYEMISNGALGDVEPTGDLLDAISLTEYGNDLLLAGR
jgi:hypothetical protein